MSRRARTRAAATAVKRMYVDDVPDHIEDDGDEYEGSTPDLSPDEWFGAPADQRIGCQQGDAHGRL